jgi:hypothetical protein
MRKFWWELFAAGLQALIALIIAIAGIALAGSNRGRSC